MIDFQMNPLNCRNLINGPHWSNLLCWKRKKEYCYQVDLLIFNRRSKCF